MPLTNRNAWFTPCAHMYYNKMDQHFKLGKFTFIINSNSNVQYMYYRKRRSIDSDDMALLYIESYTLLWMSTYSIVIRIFHCCKFKVNTKIQRHEGILRSSKNAWYVGVRIRSIPDLNLYKNSGPDLTRNNQKYTRTQ